MTTLIILLCLTLLLLIVVQLARVRDLAKSLRGREETEAKAINTTGRGLLIFMVLLLVITTASAYYFRNYMLGFGPLEAASIHGKAIDNITYWTLGVTYAAFIVTHIALFYYAYKYRRRKGHKAQYISHNNTVELLWTGIPAIIMTFLVVGGLDVWNTTMDDVPLEEAYMEIEATGYQFAWQMRYPGPDGLLGRKDYRLITGANPLGLDWSDPKTHDDILVNDVTLPVDQQIRVRITAKDVLHDFYLPQFRVKMDAVPGLPTYFIFTPTKTTKEWRRELSAYPEYQVVDEEADGERQLWETRNFELACAELCGIGHWSMARTVTIMEQDQFDEWYAQQSSYYETNIKGTDDDPLFMAEVNERNEEFLDNITSALATPGLQDNLLNLDYIDFEDDGVTLSDQSAYQLDVLVNFLDEQRDLRAIVMGHSPDSPAVEATDSTSLSESRAKAVYDYLADTGLDPARIEFRSENNGDRPAATNAPEGGESRNQAVQIYIVEGEEDEPVYTNENS